MLERVRKMQGEKCCICVDVFGSDTKVFEYMRPNTEWCGITYEWNGVYYFEHNGEFYCYRYNYFPPCTNITEFENNLINLYESLGSWYEAFNAILL